jgi:hypothetical protein
VLLANSEGKAENLRNEGINISAVQPLAVSVVSQND